MADISPYLHAGFRCDKRDCDRTLPMEQRGWHEVIRVREQQMLDVGWEIRIGRSRRHYCPDHAQRPGERWFPAEARHRELMAARATGSASDPKET